MTAEIMASEPTPATSSTADMPVDTPAEGNTVPPAGLFGASIGTYGESWSYNANLAPDSDVPMDSVPEESQAPLGGLKHGILAYLYRRAITSDFPGAISHFYVMYPYIAALVMWRMQFLDRQHLLIKLGSADNVTGQSMEPSTGHTSFFVIYSLETSKVIGVFEGNSQELFDMFDTCDEIRGASYDEPLMMNTRPSNNEHARELVRKHMYAVRKARNGGVAQAIKRILSLLPINAQSFSDSPYFDHSLFLYDDKTLNNCDRIRPFSEFPCKFYSRQTGQFKFKLETNANVAGNPRGHKSSVLYVFHPTDPFVITAQHSQGFTTVVNLHYHGIKPQ
eukprot:jgi/Hompol1/2780/HPOL_000792-RA